MKKNYEFNLIKEVVKLILIEDWLQDDSAEITSQNIVNGFRKFPKNERTNRIVKDVISKLRGYIDEE